MVSTLPENIQIGIINVSASGCEIELFDKAGYKTYVEAAPEWLKNLAKEYDGNQYAGLVDLAKIAQKDVVIKGILLHQGESNTNDVEWPTKVKNIYNNFVERFKSEIRICAITGWKGC